jgi:hypothetical protein
MELLCADLPATVLGKCEVYTFGCAGGWMGNPLVRLDELRNSSGNGMAMGQSTNGMVDGGVGSGGNGGGNGIGGMNGAQFIRPDGSIASPVKATMRSLGHRVEDFERVVPHVEHYLLEGDGLGMWGVGEAVRGRWEVRFVGRVFVIGTGAGPSVSRGLENGHQKETMMMAMNQRMLHMMDMLKAMKVESITALRTPQGRTALHNSVMALLGHWGVGNGLAALSSSTEQPQRIVTSGFLIADYLDALFPLAPSNTTVPWAPSSPSLLTTTVTVDIDVACKREYTAQSLAVPMKTSNAVHPATQSSASPTMSTASTLAGSPPVSPVSNGAAASKKEHRSSWGTASALGIDGVGKARKAALECEGRTVAELSRLWRFGGGETVVGVGVPVGNAAGIGLDHLGVGRDDGLTDASAFGAVGGERERGRGERRERDRKKERKEKEAKMTNGEKVAGLLSGERMLNGDVGWKGLNVGKGAMEKNGVMVV